MTTILEPIAAEAASAAPARPGPQRLTRRASLNAAAALLDYAVRIATTFAVTPLLVRGLGPALFGTWEMLVRLGSYVSATDGRPTEALRLLVARTHGQDPSHALRPLVGASLVVWALLAPLVLTAGTLVVWFAPALVDAAPAAAAEVRLAASLLMASMLLGSLASVPESVLRGLNLGHARIGAQLALHLVGALLLATAVWAGLGLTGLAGATLVRGILTGLSFWVIVARRVPAFGVARPARATVRAMFGMSVWLTAGDLIAKLILASDALVLGLLVAPAAVTPYVLTGQAARVAVGLHVFTAGEAMPGIGALLGAGSAARARNARRDLLTLTWLCATVSAVTILAWNRALVALWVGPTFHAGTAVDVLIVLTAIQTAFIRLDSGIIDAALRPRARVLVGAATAVATLGLSVVGTLAAGVTGLCAAVLAGRGLQSIAYPLLVARTLREAGVPDERTAGAAAAVARAAAVTALLLVLAVALGRRVAAHDWFTLGLGVTLTAAAAAGVCLAVGTGPEGRAMLRARARQLLARGSRP